MTVRRLAPFAVMALGAVGAAVLTLPRALWMLLAWVVLYRLLDQQRRTAEDAARQLERATRLRSVAELAGPMLARSDTGQAVCEAARSVAQADLACLMEPDGLGRLTVRAASEPGLPAITVKDYPGLRAATGAASLVVQPVPHEGRTSTLLAVGWRRAGAEMSPAVLEALELLAGEAGIALERADLLASLAAEARQDPLTGLWNRRAWDERLAEEQERARRAGHRLSIAMLDLDRFKAYNDRHGHQAGDGLLVHATTAWRGKLRPGDLLARWGGEEFALLLPSCSLGDAVVLVERLRACMPGGLTCSAGVVEWDGIQDAGAIVERADQALYAAKRMGRDRVVVWGQPETGRPSRDPSMSMTSSHAAARSSTAGTAPKLAPRAWK